MARVFLGNFDFEHELALSNASVGGETGRPVPARRTQMAAGDFRSDLAWAWVAIAEAGDVILAPGAIDPADFSQLEALGMPVPKFAAPPWKYEGGPSIELVPWGWSRSMLELARRHDCALCTPPLDVVRRVNGRAFRFELEQELNVGLAGAALVNSADELDAVIRSHADALRGWLLKANFGMSGREAMRGRGTSLDSNTRNWVKKRLAGAGPIVFEPIVEPIAEAGIQFDVPRAGPPELVGITPLLVDRAGVYRGSRFARAPDDDGSWQPAVDVARRVAQILQRLGYFGPLGIDAMLYCDATGRTRLRALQDLNARYTMGRLAMGFRRLLPPGWCGTWLHFSAKRLAGRGLSGWLAHLTPSLPSEATVAIASPRNIGSYHAEHQALLVLAPTPEIRRRSEAKLFNGLGITMLEEDFSSSPAERRS